MARNLFSALRRLQRLIFRFRWVKSKARLVKAGFDVNSRWQRAAPSDTPLDVVIMAIEKDLVTLPDVITSVRENILHPIEDIFIISPKSSAIKLLCEVHDCCYVDEEKVLNIKKSDINFKVSGAKHFGLDRSGWIYQQLLKLGSDRVTTQENILIVDADTIFCSPQVFMRQEKWVLNISDERHVPYRRAIHQLTGMKCYDVSFVSHHILVNRKILEKMRTVLSSVGHGEPWHDCIVKALDRSIACPFSEYELYGNFVMNTVPKNRFTLEYWHNRSFPRFRWDDRKCLKQSAINKYKTISFHQHL